MLWDANTGQQLHRFPKVGVCLDRPAFSRDGKLVAAATNDTKCVKVWDVASGEEAAGWTDPKSMCAVALSPDGRLVAAGHQDGSVALLLEWQKEKHLEDSVSITPLPVTLWKRMPLMLNRITFVVAGLLVALAGVGLTVAVEPEKTTDLRFEITVAKGLKPDTTDGRLLVIVCRDPDVEPRETIGNTGLDAPPLLGVDVKGLAADSKIVVDQKAVSFPIANLAKLPAGAYRVQAVFHSNRDLNLHDAPGNLYSEPVAVKLDPAKGVVVKLELAHKIPEETPPPETEFVKYVTIKSELLSKFHGRPMYLRAGVILPRDFDNEKDRKYPLFLRIGGYGTRYSQLMG